jgi:hypothetical protein
MKRELLCLATMLSVWHGYTQTVTHLHKNEKINTASWGKEFYSSPVFLHSLHRTMNTINFVLNEGQFDAKVLYTFNTPHANMVVFSDRLRMIILNKKETDGNKKENFTDQEKQIVDIQFPGANALVPEPVFKEGAANYNYFTGDKNTTNIKAAAELYFHNIFKGITLRIYSTRGGSLEFDWMAEKSTDYKRIKMQFSGQDRLYTDHSGNLVLKLKSGSLQLNIPDVYQTDLNGKKTSYRGSFRLVHKNTAIYTIKGLLRKDLPLVIDPILIWGSFMEGNSANFDSYLFGGVRDSNGDIYVAGGSNRITNTDLQTSAYGNPSAGFLGTPPSGSGTIGNNGSDWLIMKIKKDGSAVLTYTFLGLASTNNATREQAHCIEISPNGGTIFVGGICDAQGVSLSLPALSAGYSGNTAFGGTTSTATFTNPDGIPTIAAFTADLVSLKYRSFIGNGAPLGDVSSIEALNDNDYIVAATVTASLGNGAGAVNYASASLDQTYNAGHEIYIGKFTSFNTRSWGTYVGGDGDDHVYDMRRLSNGDIIFVGSSASTNASMTTLVNEIASTANRNNSTTNSDGLVGVITAAGTGFSMLSKVGGGNNDEITGIETGNCDTVYVVGETFSNNFPNIGAGVLQTTADANVASAAAGAAGNATGTSNNGGDMILGKFSAYGGTTGTVFTYYGGNGTDIANSIGYIPIGLGTLFIFGSTSSNSGMNTANNITGNSFYQSTFQGAWDMFFIECTPDFKSKSLATYCGGTGSDYLGNTGAQISGKQMRILSDTAISVFTTSHSGTFSPNVIANGFDVTRSNPTGGATDAWILFSLDVSDVQGPVDFGDAPTSYGKGSVVIETSGSNTTLSIGNRVDDDRYYPITPGTSANYDNNEGNNIPRKTGTAMYYDIGASGSSNVSDEDGVSGSLVIGANQSTYSLTVPFYNNSGSTATLYGYIDFNIDGTFNGPNEMASVTNLTSNTNAAGTAGRTATLVWTPPAGSLSGNSYLRLVLVKGTGNAVLTGCNGGLNYVKNQALGIGEIEDYPVVISLTLPTQVLSFTGKALAGNIRLNWQTTHEDGLDHFEIEKSVDGSVFLPIGQKPANSNTSHLYDLTDMNPFNGYNYYRLKLVENGGHLTYSNIVRIRMNSSGMPDLSIWPNPVKDILNISTNAVAPGIISIFDAKGARVLQQEIEFNAGSLPVQQLASGIYTIQYKSGNTLLTRKMIKN